MKKVFKYEVPIKDDVVIEMPEGAEVLLFAAQRGIPCVWARVDPEAPLVERRFRFAGTGHPLEANVGNHIGSFLMAQDQLVWHLFEVGGC